MKASLAAAFAAVAFLGPQGAARAAPEAHSFTFAIPDGWIDLSPGKTAENLDRLTPDVREAAIRTSTTETLLYAAAPGEDVVMSVTLRGENDSEPIDADALDRATNQLGSGAHFVIEDRRIETVDGIAWGRFVGTTEKQTRFLVYLVPGRPRSAFIMFSAPPGSFDRRLPEFESTARRTRGAAVPERKSHFPVEVAILGTMAAGALIWRTIRTKQARERANRA